jgi:ATP-binding cassette, subfamily B, bacterial PglK
MLASISQKLKALRPLWQGLSPKRRRQLFWLQALGLLAAVGEVANIGALMPFLRLLASPEEGLQALGLLAMPLRALPKQQLLLSLGLIFILMVVMSSMLRVTTIRVQQRLGALIASDMAERVFGEILRRPYSWHLHHNSSSTLTLLTQDVNQVYASIQNLTSLGLNLVLVLLLGGSLIALAPGIMLGAAFLLSGFYLLVFRFTRATLRADGLVRRSNYRLSLQVAQEGLGGIRDVLLDRTQPFYLSTYRRSDLLYRLSGASISIKAQVPRYLIEAFAIVLIVGLSLSMALTGQGIEKQLPLLGVVSLGAYRLLQPLQACFNSLTGLQANQISLRRIEPFLQPSGDAKLDLMPGSKKIWEDSGNEPLVQLKNLGFCYTPDGPWVLNELDLCVAVGERIAFVGSTGSGKSTCSDLILGLLKPSRGQVLVQGHDLHATPGLVEAWQERVAHVPQQIYLSDGSFAANIAFGIPAELIDQGRVQEAAEKARIDTLIKQSPQGYATMVGERGIRLSGGQRQRIGIARALYKQARLLVLDEATSALDNRTEAEVMEAIEALDRDLTVILIAHRLTTVRSCDRIVLLEQARIRAVGSYGELESRDAGFQALIMNHPLG